MSLLVGDYTALNASMIVIMQLERCEENRSPPNILFRNLPGGSDRNHATLVSRW